MCGVEHRLPSEVQILLQGLQRRRVFPLKTNTGEFSCAAKAAQYSSEECKNTAGTSSLKRPKPATGDVPSLPGSFHQSFWMQFHGTWRERLCWFHLGPRCSHCHLVPPGPDLGSWTACKPEDKTNNTICKKQRWWEEQNPWIKLRIALGSQCTPAPFPVIIPWLVFPSWCTYPPFSH